MEAARIQKLLLERFPNIRTHRQAVGGLLLAYALLLFRLRIQKNHGSITTAVVDRSRTRNPASHRPPVTLAQLLYTLWIVINGRNRLQQRQRRQQLGGHHRLILSLYLVKRLPGHLSLMPWFPILIARTATSCAKRLYIRAFMSFLECAYVLLERRRRLRQVADTQALANRVAETLEADDTALFLLNFVLDNCAFWSWEF